MIFKGDEIDTSQRPLHRPLTDHPNLHLFFLAFWLCNSVAHVRNVERKEVKQKDSGVLLWLQAYQNRLRGGSLLASYDVLYFVRQRKVGDERTWVFKVNYLY